MRTAEKSWVLENKILLCEFMYNSGSFEMTRFYNKRSDQELLTHEGQQHLFHHCYGTADIYANDGQWILGGDEESEIKEFGIVWGTKLQLSLHRTIPNDLTITLVFELYKEDAGLRYYTYIKNNESKKHKIATSDVLSLNFKHQINDIHYVKNSLDWLHSNEKLVDGKRNAIVQCDQDHGFAVVPENNYSTSLVTGHHKGTSEHPFLNMDIWNNKNEVRIYTDPAAVQVVLFPEEEIEYFSVNITVFSGDEWDGRMAAARHFRKRYKYHSTDRILTVNDWYFREKRNETYYKENVIPAMTSMGFDRLLVDDWWNTDRDTTEVDPSFSMDLPTFAQWTKEQNLQLGFWFSLTGDDWGLGRDLANPDTIDYKKSQMENTIIPKFLSTWQQIDLGELWLTDEVTEYSHPSDSVYRKWLGVRRYMNEITHKYPDFLMQTTCELENPHLHDQSVGLLHMPDNGIAGLFWGGAQVTEGRGEDDSRKFHLADYSPVQNMFNYFGLFPSEGMFDFWNIGYFRGTVEQYYSFLLSRHVSLYDDPAFYDETAKANLKRFTDWWRNPRIKAILNKIIAPVYNGPNNNNQGPYSWMFTSDDKSRAILVAVGDQNEDIDEFTAKLRWLDSDKTYLIQDITLTDAGEYQYSFKGIFSGCALIDDGFSINLNENTSRAKCFWIQEANLKQSQILYADHNILTYDKIRGKKNWEVQLVGYANADAILVWYDPIAGDTKLLETYLDENGNGSLVIENSYFE